MNVLILHRIDFAKIRYDVGIDHERHAVTYVGRAEKLETVPSALRCTRLVHEDLGDDRVAEAVLAALATLPGRPRFDRVVSLSEYELLAAAQVREALGAPGPSVAEAALVRDKLAMKTAVAEAGLDVPRFVPLASVTTADGRVAATALPWHGRTVLKPTHGAGSEDVVIFETAQACLQALREGATGVAALQGDAPAVGRYELEEFVEGDILHMDGLVQDGVVKVAIGSRYVGNCQQFNRNRPLGSGQFDLAPAQRDWVQRVVAAVRIRQGAFHLEAIASPRGVVFLEIGNRSGGAGVPQATSLAWDADFQALELALIVGEPRRDIGALGRVGLYYGWYVFPAHEYATGYWSAAAAMLERFRSDPRVVRWCERGRDDGFDSEPSYDLDKAPLAGLVSGETPEAVRAFMADLFAAVAWTPRVRTG